jgi:hypothetical protein
MKCFMVSKRQTRPKGNTVLFVQAELAKARNSKAAATTSYESQHGPRTITMTSIPNHGVSGFDSVLCAEDAAKQSWYRSVVPVECDGQRQQIGSRAFATGWALLRRHYPRVVS